MKTAKISEPEHLKHCAATVSGLDKSPRGTTGNGAAFLTRKGDFASTAANGCNTAIEQLMLNQGFSQLKAISK